ncbi:uncharacterized protein LOC136028222 isoform X1 [Artemia franciscana]
MVNNSDTNTKVTNIPLDYLGMNLHLPSTSVPPLVRNTESKLLKSKRKCFVCGNDSLKFPKYTFFGLPKDETRCRDWFRLMNREEMLGAPLDKLRKSKFICQIHFEKRYILDSIKRKILAFNAVPTLKPYSEINDEPRSLKAKDYTSASSTSFLACGLVGTYRSEFKIKSERCDIPSINALTCNTLASTSETQPVWKGTQIKEEADYSQCSWAKYNNKNCDDQVINNNNNDELFSNNNISLGYEAKFDWQTPTPLFNAENIGLEFFGVGW